MEADLGHVLNVSPLGARLIHLERRHAGVVSHVDLPFALGALRFTGRVVGTWLHGTEQTVDGKRRCYYGSGLEFTGLTPEQQTARGAVLEMLQTAQAVANAEGMARAYLGVPVAAN